MWSGASVAHTTPVREDLDSILKQTQDGILMEKLSSLFFQTTDLKTISFICDIVMSSWNKSKAIIHKPGILKIVNSNLGGQLFHQIGIGY